MDIKKAFLLTAVALGLAAGQIHAGSPYGLSNRPPVGPFLNNNLPPAVTDGSGGWMTVPAFPYLTFEDPTFLVAAPGTNRLYVCCRQGLIWYFQNDPNTTNKSVFLDLTGRNQGWDDCGVLGMAFHPQFGRSGSTNRGYVYVYYQYTPSPINPALTSLNRTTPTYNRLSRFTVPDGSIAADPNSELVLINQFDQNIEHNGGAMFFGLDGFLYVTNGDEGGSDDAYATAQIINQGLFSGVFRIDVNQNPATSHPIRRQPLSGATPPSGWPQSYSANYYIPNDNPFVNPNGSVLEEYFALGFRSPHRMTLDPLTGKIWLGDVGDSAREEVDIIVKGGNYQWDYQEGLNFAGPSAKPAVLIGTDTPPIYDYPHQNGDACVIGGYVYRGALHPELWGLYIFGDNYSGRMWTMAYDGTNPPTVTYLCNAPPGVGYSGLSSFGLDQNSEIYMCQMGPIGQIWTLARTGPATVQPPALLSQLGVFTNLSTLAPASSLVPYDVNCPLWSDGAVKTRWMAVPNNSGQQIGFAPTGEWTFPIGTVFVKHFELGTNDSNPSLRKRLETRVLVHGTNGNYYGLTYKWRPDNSDADLLPGSLSENITITTATGTRTQTWYYPSQQDCLICHNPNANSVLGAKTRQLNGNFTYPSTGITDNQLRTLNSIGLFNPALNEANIPTYASLASVTNLTASLETRARSYIDANCAQCHRPNSGVQALFDARFDTPLANQGITNGTVLSSLGITGAAVVAPGNLADSIMYLRVNTVGAYQMPPLARNTIDSNAIATLSAWITSLGTSGATNAPIITSQPLAVTVNQGANAQFNVTATGTAPLNYQWQFNGNNIANATGTSYVVVNAQAANAGNYSVTVANIVGSTNSVNAALGVNIPPGISTQPQSLTVNQGAGAQFNVSASGTAPLSFQWKLNGSNIAGATASSFVIASAQPANAGSYTVSISNVAGTTNSSVASLTVNSAPAITAGPQSIAVSQGANAQFSVTATGTAPLGYQWKFNSANIANATASIYTVVNAQPANVGSYSVAVSNSVGSTNSAAATLTVNSTPAINVPPQSLTVTQGANAQFNVTATGTAPLSYQWKFNNIAISGATTSALAIVNAQAANAGNYSVTVTNPAGSVTSPAAVLTVNLLPSITSQPQNVTVNQGAAAQFTVTAAGTAPFGYQWRFGGANLANATASILSISSAQTTNAGTYSVVITNVAGSITSSNAILAVNAPPLITSQPNGATANSGATVLLNVGSAGTSPLTYQWQLNGTNIPGASNASLMFTNLQAANAGSYDVVISNAWGFVKSSNAVIIVAPVTIPAPTGMVNWWPGDGNPNDIQGTNNGVLTNGTSFTTGLVGQAFNFNGVSNQVSVGAIYPSLTNTFTMLLWARPNAPLTATGQSTSGTAGLTGQRYAIFPRYGSTVYGLNHVGAGISIGTNGVSVFEHGTNLLYSPLVYSGTITGWTLVALVYTTNQPQLYVNGVLKLAGLKSPYNVHPSADMGGPYGFYSGALDEFCVYNRALSAAEIQSIYNTGNVGLVKAGQITGVTLATNGSLQLSLKDRTGGNFRIDVSTNLATWTPLATLTNSPGYSTFTDPTATNSGRRFYRQVAVP